MWIYKRVLLAMLSWGISSFASATPATIVYFSTRNACFDAEGNYLYATTSRKVVITNDDDGTANLTVKGTCPTTAGSAVNWSYVDFPEIKGCGGGPAGTLPYWKYHMRPDGNYTLKCQSQPF